MRRATAACRLLLLALGVLGAAAGVRAQEPYPLSIATGGVTGIYYQIGAAICRLLQDHPPAVPMTCTTEGSQGSVANLVGVRFGRVRRRGGLGRRGLLLAGEVARRPVGVKEPAVGDFECGLLFAHLLLACARVGRAEAERERVEVVQLA